MAEASGWSIQWNLFEKCRTIDGSFDEVKDKQALHVDSPGRKRFEFNQLASIDIGRKIFWIVPRKLTKSES